MEDKSDTCGEKRGEAVLLNPKSSSLSRSRLSPLLTPGSLLSQLKRTFSDHAPPTPPPQQTPRGGVVSISGQSPLPKASNGWRLDKQFVPDTPSRLQDISGNDHQLEHIFQEVLMLVYEEK